MYLFQPEVIHASKVWPTRKKSQWIAYRLAHQIRSLFGLAHFYTGDLAYTVVCDADYNLIEFSSWSCTVDNVIDEEQEGPTDMII